MQRSPTSRITGAVVVATAALLIAGRLAGPGSLAQLIPGGQRMGFLNMVMLACAGAAIWQLSTPWPRLPAGRRAAVTGCIVVLVLLPLGFLLETVLDISLGIDLPISGTRPTALVSHPGRTSPNGALALLSIALALACLTGRPGRLRIGVGFVATTLVGGIGSAALIGSALGLQDLYRLAGFNRLLPITAATMCVCAVGLWSLMEASLRAHRRCGRGGDVRLAVDAERQINRRSAGLFALVTVIGGVAGFAVLRSSFEEATAHNLLLTARTTATLVASEIESSLWYPRVIAANGSVRLAMSRLSTNHPGATDSAQANEALARLAERLFNDQITGAQFLDPAGKLLYSSGTLSIKSATVRHHLRDDAGGAVLFWADGYVLETRNDVVDNGRLVGVLVVETRLPRIHELLGEVQESGSTTDTALCAISGPATDGGAAPSSSQTFACGPTRFHRDGLIAPIQVDRSTVAGTLAMALGGASGTRFVNDALGGANQGGRAVDANIISAYTPVKNFGLALGVRSDVESLYAPLRARVLELLLVLLAVVVAGSLILRSQVRPLVTALGREQRRTARILENSNDAFVALDAHGLITDWNAQATRLFGWRFDEALGQALASLILAAPERAALDAAMAFDAGADPTAASRRIEVEARHRDGRPLPVEISLKTELTDDGFLAHVFIEDISERKAARDALHQSEQRLRLIANNLPALVSYIDRDFRYRFTNNQYRRWFKLDEDTLTGKTVAQVFGAEVFENVRERIGAALAGEDVAFELDSDIDGAPANMRVHYIPDRDQHGEVVGVFGMVLDQTAQRVAQERLEASQRQLRAVTDNVPILISYIDTGERVRFLNATFHDWFGIDLRTAVGRTMAEVFGANMYEQRRREIGRALAGERQEFDIESTIDGARRTLHSIYIPDQRADGGTRGIFTVSMDVTRTKLIEEELRDLSSLDTLTGLPNRRQLGDRLNLALARHQRDQVPLALMFLDIDKFKSVNDSWGHAAGDSVLRTFAARISGAVRDCDTVARLGGDEFIVVVEGLDGPYGATQVAEKILAAVRAPFAVAGVEPALALTTSIGIAVSIGGAKPGDGRDGGRALPGRDILMEAADRALYRAKQAGRDRYDLETLDPGSTTAPPG